MPDIIPDTSESNVLAALRAVLLTVVGCEVVRGQVNRVSMPKGDFIVLTPTHQMALSTPVDSFTDTSRLILRPTQFTIQVDCYGQQAQERATTITTIMRDGYGVEQFKTADIKTQFILPATLPYPLGTTYYDIMPLYASDAQQMPIETGENQFLQRWTLEVQLQTNPVITFDQESATELTVGVIPTDAQYPAE